MYKILTIVLFLSFLIPSVSLSQGISIGFGGGISNVVAPDAYSNDISNGGAGFSGEYHLGIKAKADVPGFPIVPTGFLTYHILNGSESTTGGEINTSQGILSIGAGGELSLLPGPLNPYFALDIAYNNLDDFEREAPQSAGGNTSAGGVSRMGLAIGVGVEFSLLPIDVDVSAKYHFMNMIGKESNEETISILALNATIFL